MIHYHFVVQGRKHSQRKEMIQKYIKIEQFHVIVDDSTFHLNFSFFDCFSVDRSISNLFTSFGWTIAKFPLSAIGLTIFILTVSCLGFWCKRKLLKQLRDSFKNNV